MSGYAKFSPQENWSHREKRPIQGLVVEHREGNELGAPY